MSQQIPAELESLASLFDDALLNVQQLAGTKDGGKVLVAKRDVLETKTADPVISATQPFTPSQFDFQYPQPLDPLEVMAVCEEVGVLNAIPEKRTELKVELWMELSDLYMDTVGGGQYIAFADGECPEEYEETGTYRQVTLKNLGVKKSLTLSDIKHSVAISGAGGIAA